MPTQQDIKDYLNRYNKNTVYTAHLHFNIEIEQVYEILKAQNNKKI